VYRTLYLVQLGAREQVPKTVQPSRPGSREDRFAHLAAGKRGGDDTAARIMTRDVIALDHGLTVDEAVTHLRERADHLPSQLQYIYVVDADRRLAGVVSMRDLILARPTAPLERIMCRQVVSVRAEMDQEDVAKLMQRTRYSALPVVDAGGSLLGAVAVDSVIDVMAEETTEDVHRLFGAGPDERLTSPWYVSVRVRIPWLLVNLMVAFAAASVIRLFEGTVAAWTALAVYLPIVAGMGGNASAQAMAVAIRGLAVGEAGRVPLRTVMTREFRVGIATGAVTALLAGSAALLFHGNQGVLLAVLVAASLFINQVIGPVWGASIPFVMARLGFDPAQSATIFTTTLTDMLGFLTLLGLAAAAMRLAAA
jgi:magnesium transporter